MVLVQILSNYFEAVWFYLVEDQEICHVANVFLGFVLDPQGHLSMQDLFEKLHFEGS